jgi:hypothetical protein
VAFDLNNLKEQVQTIFDTANDTAAAYDLSTGLTTRVQKVLKLNPALIPVQANWYPYVSVWVDAKDVEPADFAGNQLMAKRQATVHLKVAGAVWENAVADEAVDEADNECEQLMENIEEILRRNPQLSATVTWQFPGRIQYYNASLGEGACLRAGVMDLEATVFY